MNTARLAEILGATMGEAAAAEVAQIISNAIGGGGGIGGSIADHHLYYYNGTTWKQLDN